MTNQSQVKCPNCGTSIDVQDKVGVATFEKEESNSWFKKQVSDPLKEIIMNSLTVNSQHGKVPLKDALIPVVDEEEQWDNYYSICVRTIQPVPVNDECKKWMDILDFRIFSSLKYDVDTLLEFLKQCTPKSELLTKDNDIDLWLKDFVKYLIASNRKQLLEKHALLASKNNLVHTIKSELFWDEEIPADLKRIYKLIVGEDYDQKLLHDSLEELGEELKPLDQSKSEKDISKEIDDYLYENLEKLEGQNYLQGLQLLFSWTDDEAKNEYFKLFVQNKAKLVLETMQSEEDRNIAFDILRSEKRKVLSQLATSEISNQELEDLLNDPKAFRAFQKWKNNRVDDKERASEELGNIGEEIVNDLLQKRFESESDVEVIWAAKTGEQKFDFEIKRNGNSWIYIDAKTTNQGISNSDSVPFFMRKSQWDFLPTLNDVQMYYVARVFIEGEKPEVRWLKLKDEKI